MKQTLQKPNPLQSNEARYYELTKLEKQLWEIGYQTIAGVDEAGRGPLAGPVVAAACIIPEGIFLEGIDDSKKLTPKIRGELFSAITEDPRITYSIAVIEPDVIDRVNILQATLLAMKSAVEMLKVAPEYLLVDGISLFSTEIPAEAIKQGDSRSQSIAAAGNLAKVWRDRIMEECHRKWPVYGFDRHKGYGTASHRAAIEEFGPCEIHRKSFEPIKSQFAGFSGILSENPLN